MRIVIRFLLTAVIAVGISLQQDAYGQPQQRMSYQAVVRDANGHLVTGQAVGIRITILQGSPTGTAVYTETQTASTNDNGLIGIDIGGGAGFSSINWANGPYYLKTEIDPSGGSGYSITGTSQLLSVPYALYSKSAESADDAVKLTGDQTIAGNKTFTGTTIVKAPVAASDAATKAYVDALKAQVEELEAYTGIKVKDIDGNIYKKVTIGNQVWLAENLRTTRYSDGTAIPLVIGSTAWSNLSTPGYCWYNNDQSTYGKTYGALYNWFAVSTTTNGNKNICPTGWHAPSFNDKSTLSTFLGGDLVAGGKLKEIGTEHWASPNTGATNETGFTAFPVGMIDSNGAFIYYNTSVHSWLTDENTSLNGTTFVTLSDYSWLGWSTPNKKYGFSVRCIQD